MATTIAAGAAALAVGAGSAAAQSLEAPTAGLKKTATMKEWSFDLHGPATHDEAAEGTPTEIVVRHRQAGVLELLRPLAALDCPPGGLTGCTPIDVMGRMSAAAKRTALVVSDPDRDGVPEVSSTFYTGGPHCCFATVGFWQPQDGPRQASVLDGGSTTPVADQRGRIRIGEPRWETLDWPYASSRPFRVWYELRNGVGWVNASTKAHHRGELAQAKRAIRSLSKRRDAAGRESLRSARAVALGHAKALGQGKALRTGRAQYRRAYGAKALRNVDQGLKRVKRARR